MKKLRIGRWILGLWLAIAAGGAVSAAPHHVFWQVKGKHNSVYLLGSIHMLKSTDTALLPDAVAAYRHCKALVMEVDLNDANLASLLGDDAELETLPADQSLSQVVGQDLFAQLVAQTEPLGLDADTLSRFQPWFAALMLQELELAHAGFDPAAGIDERFAQMAAADHKPVIGLETVSEQLGFFSHLSLDEQRGYLRSTLEDAKDSQADTEAVVRAWRNGDTAQLEQLLREGSAESPRLFQSLTTDRNQRWLPKITALLGEEQDYLVVVGALHLVGHDGLVELLQRAGYDVVQH